MVQYIQAYLLNKLIIFVLKFVFYQYYFILPFKKSTGRILDYFQN